MLIALIGVKMPLNLRTLRSELPKVVISITAMVLAILSFFGITEKYFTKEKIPSVILALLSGITIAEVIERWDLQEKDRHSQELKTLTENLFGKIEGELTSISNIAQLIQELEGESFSYSKDFSGDWLSIYQGHHDPDSAELVFDWCLENIEIVELGRLIYFETKSNEKAEVINALGKLIEERTVIGHWVTCASNGRKKGEFLLQQDGNGDLLYGVYSTSHDQYQHPFYNWILVNKKNLLTNEVKSFETIYKQIQKAWAKLKPLTMNPDLSEFPIDDLKNRLLNLEKLASAQKKSAT